jgi:hypothetical protein
MADAFRRSSEPEHALLYQDSDRDGGIFGKRQKSRKSHFVAKN